MQRLAVKKMLAAWEQEFPGRTESIASALRRVELEHLGDRRHFDFAGLEARRLTPPKTTEPRPGKVAPMSEEDEDALADAFAAFPALA